MNNAMQCQGEGRVGGGPQALVVNISRFSTSGFLMDSSSLRVNVLTFIILLNKSYYIKGSDSLCTMHQPRWNKTRVINLICNKYVLKLMMG